MDKKEENEEKIQEKIKQIYKKMEDYNKEVNDVLQNKRDYIQMAKRMTIQYKNSIGDQSTAHTSVVKMMNQMIIE